MDTPQAEDSLTRFTVLIVLIAIVVSLVGFAFDRMLIHEGVPRYDLMALSNTLTGVVAGGFFWQALRRERERRHFIRQRLHTISEMNHHIRNALQVISFQAYRDQNEKNVEVVRQAVNRIEWALKEVLPGEIGVESNSPRSNSEQIDRCK
jgi:two-component sensor histidine kinase